MLEEDDGVVAADSRLEEGLGVGHCGACNQLHSRNALEVTLQSLAVLGPELATHPTRTPDHHGYLQCMIQSGVENDMTTEAQLLLPRQLEVGAT